MRFVGFYDREYVMSERDDATPPPSLMPSYTPTPPPAATARPPAPAPGVAPTPPPTSSPSPAPPPGRPNIDVHGSDFTKAAGAFVDEHDDLDKDARWILDAIAALGDFAGTDDTAHTFRQGYATALKSTTTYVAALRDLYPGIAERLAGMKTGFDVANWANIQSLPKVSDLPDFTAPAEKPNP